MSWVARARGSECFHGNLMTNEEAIAAAVDYLRQMDNSASSSPALKASYLFQVPSAGRSRSGTLNNTDTAGKTWSNNTTMWVGCGWDDRTEYKLDGKHSSITSTPALRAGSPEGMSVDMKIMVDGKTVHGQTLTTEAVGAPSRSI